MLIFNLQPLVSFLLGDAGATTPPPDIFFQAPRAPREVADIPSLNGFRVSLPSPRKGCVIGWEYPASVAASFFSKTVPLELSDLGEHVYGGPLNVSLRSRQPIDDRISLDSIGHMYTKYGGIIDIAHVRDHADIARYVATQVVAKFRNGGTILLGEDMDQYRPSTGKMVVKIKPQGKEPTAYQAAVLGAVISYEVAIWHEIATYKSWQDYSSFSPEDNYSNLLGAYVGFKACLTERFEYNEVVPSILYRALLALGAQPRPVTTAAVEFVRDHWYHYTGLPLIAPTPMSYPLLILKPDVYLFLDRRHVDTGYNEDRVDRISPSHVVSPWRVNDVSPWRVNGDSKPLPEVCRTALITDPPSNFLVSIHIPTTDENNNPLSDFYSFEIQKPSNADMSIFDSLDIKEVLSSTKFGFIVERIRKKFLERDFNADKPQ